MNLDELRDLLQLLDEREIAEFELEEKDLKLRVRKAAHAPVPVVAPVLPAPLAVPAQGAAPPPSAPAAPSAAPAPVEEEALEVIKSPIVGTFYRAPDPNSAPFVSVGDRIKPGQVLCIVEAMKLMNEIEAETSGEIVKVHKENGQPVQYGEPLFSIRP